MIYINYNAKTGEFKSKDKSKNMVMGFIKGYGKHTPPKSDYDTEYFDLYLENQGSIMQVSFTKNWTTFWLFNALLNTDHKSEITITSFAGADKKFFNLGMELNGEKLKGKYDYAKLNMPDHKYEKMDKMKEYCELWINELIAVNPFLVADVIKVVDKINEVDNELPF
jgi:hypothetical protein